VTCSLNVRLFAQVRHSCAVLLARTTADMRGCVTTRISISGDKPARCGAGKDGAQNSRFTRGIVTWANSLCRTSGAGRRAASGGRGGAVACALHRHKTCRHAGAPRAHCTGATPASAPLTSNTIIPRAQLPYLIRSPLLRTTAATFLHPSIPLLPGGGHLSYTICGFVFVIREWRA